MPTPNVYIFWDNSNIYISAQNYADLHEGIGVKSAVRIAFEAMYRLAHAGRNVAGGVAIGSIPPDHADLWNRFRQNTQMNLELYEHGEISGKEQGVDQCIQTHMLRALADTKEPQIAVLLTGDGSGYDDGVGFHADLERMYKRGWGIEVVSWDLACNQALKQWATRVGKYIKLDDYYNSITFVQGARTAAPLSLTRRQSSTIGGSEEYKAEIAKAKTNADTAMQKAKLERENNELLKEIEKLKQDKEKAEEKAKYLKRCVNAKAKRH